MSTIDYLIKGKYTCELVVYIDDVEYSIDIEFEVK